MQVNESILRIAVQKSGRLNEKSLKLLEKCGFQFEVIRGQLLCRDPLNPVELLLVRDDDIPSFVKNQVCDIGVVGENVFEEVVLGDKEKAGDNPLQVLRKLGFGRCRLSLAVPKSQDYQSPKDLEGLTIATSYPAITKDFLATKGVKAQVVEISGSVEVAPAVGVADVITDLVSTGATLASNGLKEVATLIKSEAILIQNNRSMSPEKKDMLAKLLQRLDGVMKAARSRYIMMNAAKTDVDKICKLLPGMDNPTIVPIGTDGKDVAIHAVAPEAVFWETMEALKEAGAHSILVVPIEKIVE